MARSQTDDLCFFLLLLFCLDAADGCTPISKELHICLNIYLERDFPIIETILKGQQSPGYGDGRVLLEGQDLEDICRHIRSLQKCYETLLIECDTYWQLYRYQMLMQSMNATTTFLCGHNRTTNVRDILLNGACVRSAETDVGRCAQNYGIRWAHSWKEMLRLQVGPNDRCSALQQYKICFDEEMKMITCGIKARVVYGKLINLWLDNWCSTGINWLKLTGSASQLGTSMQLRILVVVMYLFVKNVIICDF